VSGSQLPILQDTPDIKVQQIQGQGKWRPEPQLRVSKILGLNGKGAFICSRGACARRLGPGPLPSGRGGPVHTLRPSPPPPKSAPHCGDFQRFRWWLLPPQRVHRLPPPPYGGGQGTPMCTSIPTPKTSRLFTFTGAKFERTSLWLGLLHHNQATADPNTKCIPSLDPNLDF
jgi:hypothetical protein